MATLRGHRRTRGRYSGFAGSKDTALGIHRPTRGVCTLGEGDFGNFQNLLGHPRFFPDFCYRGSQALNLADRACDRHSAISRPDHAAQEDKPDRWEGTTESTPQDVLGCRKRGSGFKREEGRTPRHTRVALFLESPKLLRSAFTSNIQVATIFLIYGKISFCTHLK